MQQSVPWCDFQDRDKRVVSNLTPVRQRCCSLLKRERKVHCIRWDGGAKQKGCSSSVSGRPSALHVPRCTMHFARLHYADDALCASERLDACSRARLEKRAKGGVGVIMSGQSSSVGGSIQHDSIQGSKGSESMISATNLGKAGRRQLNPTETHQDSGPNGRKTP